MKPEITEAMADKMLEHAIIDAQVLSKVGGGLAVYSFLRLQNGYDICSTTFDLPSHMTLDLLLTEDEESEEDNVQQAELAELKAAAVPGLKEEAKKILMAYRGFQFQRAMMSFYELA